jgi:hypothetical protein
MDENLTDDAAPAPRPVGLPCARCGARVPLRSVSFYQNIGMLVARQTKTVSGSLCGPCIRSTFWSCTLTTALVGWIGTFSIILAPIFILINVSQLLLSGRLVGWGNALAGTLFALGIPAAAITTLVLSLHGPVRH